MTVSTLDIEELKKRLGRDSTNAFASPSFKSDESKTAKPVSGLDLIERAKDLFTAEEADALAGRIEESCEQIDD